MNKKVLLFMGIGLIILVTAIIFLWSYITHGKLSGNVFIAMKSGDIKRAAGIEVYLLKSDTPDNILAEVAKLQNEYAKPLIEELQKHDDAVERAKIDMDLYEKSKNSNTDEQFIRAGTWSDMANEHIKNSKVFEAAFVKIRKELDDKIKNLLSPLKFKQVKTDINGYYEFLNVPQGKYILFASYKVFDENISWLYPIEINNRENKADLTNSNMKNDFYFTDL